MFHQNKVMWNGRLGIRKFAENAIGIRYDAKVFKPTLYRLWKAARQLKAIKLKSYSKPALLSTRYQSGLLSSSLLPKNTHLRFYIEEQLHLPSHGLLPLLSGLSVNLFNAKCVLTTSKWKLTKKNDPRHLLLLIPALTSEYKFLST